jgi:hypothetical protein
MFTRLVCLASVVATSALGFERGPASENTARLLLARAMEAMGGEAALASITSLQLESIGHDYFIDQSERPEGPFVVRYLSTLEKRDVVGGRSRLEAQQRFVLIPDWSPASVTVVDSQAAAFVKDGRMTPADLQVFEDGRERIELAPERLLQTARAAPDLEAASDVRLQGLLQNVVTFSWRGRRARLLLNSHDGLPTALELRAQDPSGIWGVVSQTKYFSFWTLLPGGMRYPAQVDLEWNGTSKASTTTVKISVNVPIDSEELKIPSDVRQRFTSAPAGGWPSLKLDKERRREIGAGVVQYAGAWNVGVVEQSDGLVVVEAPIGSHYSVQVLDELATRYPSSRVKALITTSDAWPHLGGVREYVARGIPIYALDLNQSILERLLEADYGNRRDALAATPRAPRFTWVSAKTIVGSGRNRIELHPAWEENGERMMLAFFPELRLLYTSDEIQKLPSGEYFAPEYLTEVRDVINREHLDVQTIFGMHIGAVPWTEIDAAIAKAASR